MSKRLQGHFVRSGVDRRGAYSEMFIEGATADEVAAMFKEAPFDRFFETASSRARTVDADGQRAKENPMGRVMGHVDLMETHIRERGRDAQGVRIGSEFSGFLNGKAELDIAQEPGGVRIREHGTQVRPDMTKIPVAGAMQRTFEQTVPVAGPVAKVMREAGEGMMGQVFQGVHALLARRSPDRMADSLQKKRRTGRW